ncbi:hypothetical protein HO133_010030 [Letharia lupina]|uniref:Uncharacterized protein n=1 Tax=Letharia lupina TaxID=560253 RepID=A0A8H6CKL3_9LECA|nr:uncharacterized protein HO133_010030 [Letharia lupina]KAF6224836.1 hypothetical protein HO133_010030 [Letharia lupina]
MSVRDLPVHQPKLIRQQTILLQNKLHSTFYSGGIAHPIIPRFLDRASMLQNLKANSCTQPALPVNTQAAQQHAGSEKSSSPRVQHKLLPLSTKEAPPNVDSWTTVSGWLATSQTFEKPPTPAPVADPAPRQRRPKEYWLQVAKSLDLRVKSRSEQFKAPIRSTPGSICANPGLNSSISNPQPHTKLRKPDEHTPPDQPDTATDTVSPLLPNTMGPPRKQERERKSSIEANISEIQGKLEKHRRGQEQQERLEAQKLEKADEAVKRKAEKLAADAMATHRKEQERKEYVEGRAQDIHENLLQCKPFDMDAVRREFSEREVQDITKIVRELGFAKKE